MDIDAIRKRLDQLQTTNQRSNNLWKPSPGKQIVRIVPFKYNKSTPFIELYFHYDLGGRTYLSPISFGRPDPIEEFADKLKSSGNRDDWRLGKKLEAKMRTFAPVIVRGEEAEGVKFWGFGKEVYQELLGVIADPDYGDITDPANGRDITIEFLTADEAGRSFPKTNIRVKPNTTPISEDKNVLSNVSNNQTEVTEIYQELSYDELKDALEKWVSGESEDTPPAESETETETETNVTVEASETKVTQPASATAEKSGLNTAATEDVEAAFEELFKS